MWASCRSASADLCHAYIALGSRGRGHINEQVRLVYFTGFRQMHLVSGPARAVFLAITGFLIVRRIDARGLPQECPTALANAVDRSHSDSSAARLAAGC